MKLRALVRDRESIERFLRHQGGEFSPVQRSCLDFHRNNGPTQADATEQRSTADTKDAMSNNVRRATGPDDLWSLHSADRE